MVMDSVARYITSNPLTVFNTLLLLFTGYLSYSSFVFQTRTSIRESLEQLDDVEFRSGKLRPILHSFRHSAFSNSECLVELKYYQNGKNPASANRPGETFRGSRYHVSDHHPEWDRKNPIDRETFLSAVEACIPTPPEIMEAKVDESRVLLSIKSDDAVLVRRLTEGVMEQLYEILMQGPDSTIEELGLEEE